MVFEIEFGSDGAFMKGTSMYVKLPSYYPSSLGS